MKNTDFRIGNYLQHKEHLNEIFKVIGITEQCIQIKSPKIHGYFDWKQVDIDVLPIPLTEDWVLKFNFVKQENNWKRLCVCDDYIYFYWEKLAGFELSVNNHSITLSHIKYVHQLQNLYFSLTNQELNYDQRRTKN